MKHLKLDYNFNMFQKIMEHIGFFVALLFLISFPFNTLAQSVKVKGIVSDENGEPMIGAYVSVEGTKTFVATGLKGEYEIPARKNQTLVFSLLGYKSTNVKVGDKAIINVKLQQDNTKLDEAVVVGYGVQKRRDIVGAIESINTDEISDRTGSSMNFSRALQGAIPGLSLTFSDGKPSRGAKIRIRGDVNSIGSGGSALVLVDGVESDINTVNPDDIASVTVLKDAASAAVYGSRGTFGVILLTTKTPKEGKAKINYNGYFNVYERSVKPEYITNGYLWTSEFLESFNNCDGVDPKSINNVFPFSRAWYAELKRRNEDPSFEKWRINPSNNRYEYYGNTDWYDLFFKKLSTGQQHNVSISGGNKTATYYLSGRYFTQDGIYKEGDERYEQFNVTGKGSVNVRPWFRINSTLSYSYRDSHQPTIHTGNTITPMNVNRMFGHQAFPMTIPKNPDGSWTEAAVYTGYAGFVEGLSWRKDNLFELKNLNSVTVDIIKDVLVAKAKYAYYYANRNRRQAMNPYSFNKGPGITASRPSTSYYVEHPWIKHRHAADATLTFTPRLGQNHSLTVLVGWNAELLKRKSDKYYREGLIIPDKPNWSLMNGEEMEIRDNGSFESALNGYFFRTSYGYKGKYLAEISGRYDGNSKFPSNSRWGFFPSASLGWRISEEGFLKNVTWLDNLKVRTSIGSSGNGLISDAYAYQSTMSISKSNILSGGNSLNYTVAPSPIPSSLTWEKAETYDLGLDFEAFNGRLNMVADIYKKYTKDMYIVGPELPAVYGNSAPKGNYGTMKTDGWELSISWRNAHKVGGKTLSYNIKGTIYDSKSKITKYTSENKFLPTLYTTRYYSGMELGEIWGYECNELFQYDVEALAYADMNSHFHARKWEPRAGDPKFEDLNQDGVVNNGSNTLDDHGDLKKIGNKLPRYNFSISMGANWNGFGINMMWIGVGHRDWYPAKDSANFWGKYGRPYSVCLPWHQDRWSPENRDAYWPRLVGYAAVGKNAVLTKPNTRYLQNAAFLRLKNLTIDYTLPKKWCEKISMKGIKLFVSGDNLLTFTPLSKHAKNFDPEGIFHGDADYNGATGKDNFGDGDGWPVMKCYTFGLNVTF